MSSMDYREGVAIFEIVIYFVCAPLAIFLCTRHGFAKSSGWYFLVLLALFRLAAGICTLVYTQAYDKDDVSTATNAAIGAIVCNGTGLSPLNLMVLGLLSRVNDHTAEGAKLPPTVFRFLNLVSLVGLILSIVGGTSNSYNGGNVEIATESKAAVILFFVIFIIQVLLTIWFGIRSSAIEKGEKRLVLAVAISSLFLIVRYAYQLEYTFTGKQKWSSVFGNVTLFLVLSVLTEMVIVGTCIAIGITLRRAPAKAHPHEELAEQGVSAKEYEPARGQPQVKRRKARGPITWLFYTIQDSFENRNKSQTQSSHQLEGYTHK